MMILVPHAVLADEREQNRNARIHLARITIHHRLRKMERIHQAVLLRLARVAQHPATEFGSNDCDRAVGVSQSGEAFCGHKDDEGSKLRISC